MRTGMMMEVTPAAEASSPTSTTSPLSTTASTQARLEEGSAAIIGDSIRGRNELSLLTAQPSIRGPSPKGAEPPGKPGKAAMDDEAIDAEARREDDSFFSGYHCFACCYGLPSWLQYLSYVLGGSFILLSPAMVIYVLAYTRFGGVIRPIDGQVAAWSFFFAGMWALLLTLWRVIGLLPLIMTSCIILLFKRCPENVRLALEFISALQSWATYAAWSILNVILFQLLFLSPLVSPYYAGNSPETKYLLDVYATLFAVLTTIMVFCIFVFVQKLFLHSIAVNFHRYMTTPVCNTHSLTPRYIQIRICRTHASLTEIFPRHGQTPKSHSTL